ncbi:hypothetical protein PF002_g28488 [Phytophthora fragariae]|uniref:Retrotransposon gag domain-containing protein n=1 Tax=Phytophthora fragariae TaxID=53985 RepID=A0A6A3W0T1_9STRA|nr:hypothetical protein PF002_g28488 [Phytophthora fragariae]
MEAGADPHDGDESDDGDDSDTRRSGHGDHEPEGDCPDRTAPAGGTGDDGDAGRPTRRAASRSNWDEEPRQTAVEDDELESMIWWDALTPSQQRAMMKRFVLQPPTAPALPVAAPAAPVTTPSTPVFLQKKMKKLLIDNFHGNADESLEAWLATIPQEVQRHLTLGGSTWSTKELYYGVTAHLKGAANKWFIGVSEGIEPDERTLEFITMKMRKKYGRRETGWQIQERLRKRVQQPGERVDAFADSLVNIGFGKRVSAESYVEAFLNGLNNQIAAAQVRNWSVTTLEEAVQAAIETWGEFGEGRKVTDWKEAKQLYRSSAEQSENDSTTRNAGAKPEPADQIDWAKLGLGFGGSGIDDSAPTYDVNGKAVSEMNKASSKTQAGVLPLAALQAIAFAAGAGQVAATQLPAQTALAGKPKVGRTLEVKGHKAVTINMAVVETATRTTAVKATTVAAEAATTAGRVTTPVGLVITVAGEEAFAAEEVASAVVMPEEEVEEERLPRSMAVKDTTDRRAENRSDSRRMNPRVGTAVRLAIGGVSAGCVLLTCKAKHLCNWRQQDQVWVLVVYQQQDQQQRYLQQHLRRDQPQEHRRETRRGSRGRGSAVRRS